MGFEKEEQCDVVYLYEELISNRVLVLPMSSSSNDTSSACNSKVDGEVMVQDPLGV
jgi:hypothetical protein